MSDDMKPDVGPDDLGLTFEDDTEEPDDDQLTADASGAFVTDDVDCRNCEHASVCQLFAAMRQNAEQFAQDRGQESPVDPGVLAVRCDMFKPVE